jgi:hypothetical protein
MDGDRSGLLGQEEFARGLTYAGMEAPAAAVRGLFAAFDAGGDGCVDWHEVRRTLLAEEAERRGEETGPPAADAGGGPADPADGSEADGSEADGSEADGSEADGFEAEAMGEGDGDAKAVVAGSAAAEASRGAASEPSRSAPSKPLAYPGRRKGGASRGRPEPGAGGGAARAPQGGTATGSASGGGTPDSPRGTRAAGRMGSSALPAARGVSKPAPPPPTTAAYPRTAGTAARAERAADDVLAAARRGSGAGAGSGARGPARSAADDVVWRALCASSVVGQRSLGRRSRVPRGAGARASAATRQRGRAGAEVEGALVGGLRAMASAVRGNSKFATDLADGSELRAFHRVALFRSYVSWAGARAAEQAESVRRERAEERAEERQFKHAQRRGGETARRGLGGAASGAVRPAGDAAGARSAVSGDAGGATGPEAERAAALLALRRPCFQMPEALEWGDMPRRSEAERQAYEDDLQEWNARRWPRVEEEMAQLRRLRAEADAAELGGKMRARAKGGSDFSRDWVKARTSYTGHPSLVA